MELLYFKSPVGNFGDDLNAVMWRALLPADLFDDDDTILMGIGSILNSEQGSKANSSGKRVFVLGTGAGYGPLPPGWQNWNILAVRGPLTATLIGRPELAVSDSAALVAILPSIVSMSAKQDQTLFIPHHHSMVHGKWNQVAKSAGLTFVDPRWDIARVMQHFSRAKLVITEAMHGAILADSLRIPWIPVLTSPDIFPFKWRDWTLSLDLPYRPHSLYPSSFWERHHHRFLVRQAAEQGLVPSGLLENVDSGLSLVEDFRRRYDAKNQPVSGAEKTTATNGRTWRPRLGPLRPVAHRVLGSADSLFIERAAGKLSSIAAQTPYLSGERILTTRINQLQEACRELERAVRH
jgi:succinoglycan biosynthesis protein ExoV